MQNPAQTRKIIKRTRFLSYPGSAFIKIAEGCNNRCTYCTIPLIRGNLQSRGIHEIVDEVAHFLSCGIKEIILVAQDTGSFSRDINNGEDIKIQIFYRYWSGQNHLPLNK